MTDPREQKAGQAASANNRIDTLAAVLLSLATLAVAWAGYQSTRWHSEQAIAQAKATSSRIEATRMAGLANRQGQIDIALFTQWIDARASGDAKLARFYRKAFTDRLTPAFRAWIATQPFTSKDAPTSPFEMKQYRPASFAKTEALERTAAVASARAIEDIKRADRYLLTVVFFASCLFFAGISTRLASPATRRTVLALGWVMFVLAGIWMLTFPVSVVL